MLGRTQRDTAARKRAATQAAYRAELEAQIKARDALRGSDPDQPWMHKPASNRSLEEQHAAGHGPHGGGPPDAAAPPQQAPHGAMPPHGQPAAQGVSGPYGAAPMAMGVATPWGSGYASPGMGYRGMFPPPAAVPGVGGAPVGLAHPGFASGYVPSPFGMSVLQAGGPPMGSGPTASSGPEAPDGSDPSLGGGIATSGPAGSRDGARAKLTEAEERRQAYVRSLDEQVRLKRERQEAEKRQREKRERREEEEARRGFFGRGRGGGGEPMRNEKGEIVADLRALKKRESDNSYAGTHDEAPVGFGSGRAVAASPQRMGAPPLPAQGQAPGAAGPGGRRPGDHGPPPVVAVVEGEAAQTAAAPRAAAGEEDDRFVRFRFDQMLPEQQQEVMAKNRRMQEYQEELRKQVEERENAKRREKAAELERERREEEKLQRQREQLARDGAEPGKEAPPSEPPAPADAPPAPAVRGDRAAPPHGGVASPPPAMRSPQPRSTGRRRRRRGGDDHTSGARDGGDRDREYGDALDEMAGYRVPSVMRSRASSRHADRSSLRSTDSTSTDSHRRERRPSAVHYSRLQSQLLKQQDALKEQLRQQEEMMKALRAEVQASRYQRDAMEQMRAALDRGAAGDAPAAGHIKPVGIGFSAGVRTGTGAGIGGSSIPPPRDANAASFASAVQSGGFVNGTYIAATPAGAGRSRVPADGLPTGASLPHGTPAFVSPSSSWPHQPVGDGGSNPLEGSLRGQSEFVAVVDADGRGASDPYATPPVPHAVHRRTQSEALPTVVEPPTSARDAAANAAHRRTTSAGGTLVASGKASMSSRQVDAKGGYTRRAVSPIGPLTAAGAPVHIKTEVPAVDTTAAVKASTAAGSAGGEHGASSAAPMDSSRRHEASEALLADFAKGGLGAIAAVPRGATGVSASDPSPRTELFGPAAANGADDELDGLLKDFMDKKKGWSGAS